MRTFACDLKRPEGPVALPDGSFLVVEGGRGTVTQILPGGATPPIIATPGEQRLERAERDGTEHAVGGDIGIVNAPAVERVQRPLQEANPDRRAHVDADVEQANREGLIDRRQPVEAQPGPVALPVDGNRGVPRHVRHQPSIAHRSGRGSGDPPHGLATTISRVVAVAPFPADHRVNCRYNCVHVRQIVGSSSKISCPAPTAVWPVWAMRT